MPKLMRNVIAVLVGLVIGGCVNMGLIMLSPALVPPPTGVDMTTEEGLARGMKLLQPRHFVMPFLAHALGTLAGALAAYLMAASHKARFAYAIGFVYLCGGVAACFMIPAPAWFMALDLLVAYLPMAWLAIRIGTRMQSGTASAR